MSETEMTKARFQYSPVMVCVGVIIPNISHSLRITRAQIKNPEEVTNKMYGSNIDIEATPTESLICARVHICEFVGTNECCLLTPAPATERSGTPLPITSLVKETAAHI